ncbi:MAG: hypothetical protein LBP40_04095 [Campylobacteraceae bacterium]|jgi:uncharacterized protein (UPF0128 family)|nr:hypothetical protein [Campylobacteraceae bacterium]
MKISSNFNRFIFAVLKDLHSNCKVLKIDEPKAELPIQAIDRESLRNLLKYLDMSYPRDERGIPLSYRDLNSKQMTEHVNWIERQAGFSGVELSHITREWARIMAQYKL